MDRAAAVPGCVSLSWGSSAQLPAGWLYLQPGLLATPESRVRLVAQQGQGKCSAPAPASQDTLLPAPNLHQRGCIRGQFAVWGYI